MTADCVIVGAGPAGSAAAIHLTRLGHDVVLLDRKRFPRAKPCGDCLSPQANLLLERLGVLDRVLASGPAKLNGWRIFAPDGSSFTANFDAVSSTAAVQHALAISRERFDVTLVEAAEQAGARVVTGAQVSDLVWESDRVSGVRIRTRAGTQALGARIVVGADGLRSVVRARLHLQTRPARLRKLSFTLHVTDIADLCDYGEMHVVDGGCIGVAPVTNGSGPRECNLTVVVDADRFGRDAARDPRAFIQSIVDRCPGLHERVPAGALDGPRPLAAGPFDRPVRAASLKGAALIGDAAGYYDPFTGQGIYQALAGAELFGSSVRRFGLTDRALCDYARKHAALVRWPRLVQQGIEAACSRPSLASQAIGALSAAPHAASMLIGVTGDIEAPFALLSPRVLVSFLVGMNRRRP